MAATLDSFEKEIAGALPMQRPLAVFESGRMGHWVSLNFRMSRHWRRLMTSTTIPIDGGSLVVSGAKL
jgi:hypothetical protein